MHRSRVRWWPLSRCAACSRSVFRGRFYRCCVRTRTFRFAAENCRCTHSFAAAWPLNRRHFTDQHTVNLVRRRISFAPPVRDFAEEGFRLVGGSSTFCKADGRRSRVYGRRKHFISVFVWPEPVVDKEQYVVQRTVINEISWNRAGCVFAPSRTPAATTLPRSRS